jgi:hypothetical protein
MGTDRPREQSESDIDSLTVAEALRRQNTTDEELAEEIGPVEPESGTEELTAEVLERLQRG